MKWSDESGLKRWLRATTFLTMVIGCFLTGVDVWAGKVAIKRDISYWNENLQDSCAKEHQLDIYYPKTSSPTSCEVLVFIHGGSWNHGDKRLYMLLGRKMARLGKVAVIINYRLTPKAIYNDMLKDCATAIDWVHKNIQQYNGDPERIVVSGHSAGGHLAACLMVTDIFSQIGVQNPIKGCVLIDAFGLDLLSYLSTYKTSFDVGLYRTFGNKPEDWKKASPFYSLKENAAPCLIFAGSKTYPPIINDSQRFAEKLNMLGCCAEYIEVQGKKHKGMIIQMFLGGRMMYDKILSFMQTIETKPAQEQLSYVK